MYFDERPKFRGRPDLSQKALAGAKVIKREILEKNLSFNPAPQQATEEERSALLQ